MATTKFIVTRNSSVQIAVDAPDAQDAIELVKKHGKDKGKIVGNPTENYSVREDNRPEPKAAKAAPAAA